MTAEKWGTVAIIVGFVVAMLLFAGTMAWLVRLDERLQ